MRRLTAWVLALLMVLTLSASAWAADPIRVILDGSEVVFDAEPFSENGRTFVPVRAIAERLGFTVTADPAGNEITLSRPDMVILLWANSDRLILNGRESKLEAPTKKQGGRTFVPVRFFVEALGADVEWDGVNRAVIIKASSDPDAVALLLRAIQRTQQMNDEVGYGTGTLKLALSGPGPDSSLSLSLPVEMEYQLYQDSMVFAAYTYLPTLMTPMIAEMAIHDGSLWIRAPYVADEWTPVAPMSLDELRTGGGMTDASGIDYTAVAQDALLQMARITYDGSDVIETVPVQKVDLVIPQAKLKQMLDAYMMMMGEDSGFQFSISEFRFSYWIDAETAYTYRVAMGFAFEATQTTADGQTHFGFAFSGEANSWPISEPIPAELLPPPMELIEVPGETTTPAEPPDDETEPPVDETEPPLEATSPAI